MTITIHFMLVSAQAAPNVLPVLDPALKPGKAVLVVTQKMRRQADALQAVLIEAGVRVERVVLTDEHDFSRMQEALMEVATQHEGADIAFNLTGGTKLMALAAQSVALAARWKMFYVDLDTDEVIWLGDNAAPWRRTRSRIRSRLRPPHRLSPIICSHQSANNCALGGSGSGEHGRVRFRERIAGWVNPAAGP